MTDANRDRGDTRIVVTGLDGSSFTIEVSDVEDVEPAGEEVIYFAPGEHQADPVAVAAEERCDAEAAAEPESVARHGILGRLWRAWLGLWAGSRSPPSSR